LPTRESINRFFLLTGLWVLLHVSAFTNDQSYSTLAVALWTLATTVSYTFLYLLPALIPGYLLHRLLLRRPATRAGVATLALLLIGLTGMIHVLLFADRVIYGMYGFHINGFVLDLVFTPGGIASLGASRSTELTASLVVIALLALQAATYYWVTRRAARSRPSRWTPRAGWVLLAILSFAVGERVAYGFSAAANYQPILFASERYPLYLPTTFRKLASRLGFSGAPEGDRRGACQERRPELSAAAATRRAACAPAQHRLAGRRIAALRHAGPHDHAAALGFVRAFAAPREPLQRRQYHPDGHLLDVLRPVRQLLVSDAGGAPIASADGCAAAAELSVQPAYQPEFYLSAVSGDGFRENGPGRHACAVRRSAAVATRPAEHRRHPPVYRQLETRRGHS
jgi:hypothetical protein